jgi:predicted nucleic acid-binding protein
LTRLAGKTCGSVVGAAEASRAGSLLLSLPIVLEPLARSRPLLAIQPLARKHRLSAYDGAYLELAVRRGIPMATLDPGLRRAAKKEGVELVSEWGSMPAFDPGSHLSGMEPPARTS